MAELHIIISGLDTEEDALDLALALGGEGDDTSPALEVERVVRGLGDAFSNAEFMEYQVADEDQVVSVRYWL